MLSFFASVVVAQVSTDYVCWADMGTGIIDMSYLCGTNQANSEPTIIYESSPHRQEFEALSDPGVRLTSLPGLGACAQNNSSVEQCAADLMAVANYATPGGTLEIVQPIVPGPFWVRVPAAIKGYGPFERRSQATDFARTNFQQFFNASAQD